MMAGHAALTKVFTATKAEEFAGKCEKFRMQLNDDMKKRGAPVQFKSAASVMVVCQFCKTTLLKDADSVSNLGKMSEVLEDYSPLQIGTSGQFGPRSFSLIGRIQLQYADGYWNEWYVLFDDGSNGWLSDASGQYTMTFAQAMDAALPLFEKLVPGHVMTVSGQVYATSDVRTAQCTAGQGELPFKVGQGPSVAIFGEDRRRREPRGGTSRLRHPKPIPAILTGS